MLLFAFCLKPLSTVWREVTGKYWNNCEVVFLTVLRKGRNGQMCFFVFYSFIVISFETSLVSQLLASLRWSSLTGA